MCIRQAALPRVFVWWVALDLLLYKGIAKHDLLLTTKKPPFRAAHSHLCSTDNTKNPNYCSVRVFFAFFVSEYELNIKFLLQRGYYAHTLQRMSTGL